MENEIMAESGGEARKGNLLMCLELKFYVLRRRPKLIRDDFNVIIIAKVIKRYFKIVFFDKIFVYISSSF
jgi:hypothetical protein